MLPTWMGSGAQAVHRLADERLRGAGGPAAERAGDRGSEPSAAASAATAAARALLGHPRGDRQPLSAWVAYEQHSAVQEL